jgi:uncharacterized membrane protein YdjX (TVP38/TMEM64 family)
VDRDREAVAPEGIDTGIPPTSDIRAIGVRCLGLVLLLAAILLVLRALGIPISGLTVERVRQIVHGAGAWGPVILVLIITMRVLAPFTITIGLLSIATGLLYGFWPGFAYMMIGGWLGAFLGFFAARHLGRRSVERFHWIRRGRIGAMNALAENRGLKMIIVMRIVPFFPYDVVNYVAGLSRIPFRVYAIGTLVGMIPGGCVSTFLGSSATRIGSPKFFIALALTAILVVSPLVYRGIQERRRKPALSSEPGP